MTGAIDGPDRHQEEAGDDEQDEPGDDPQTGEQTGDEQGEDRRRDAPEHLAEGGVEGPVARVLDRVDEGALEPRGADHGGCETEEREPERGAAVVRVDRLDDEREQEVDDGEHDEREHEEPEEEPREERPGFVENGADAHAAILCDLGVAATRTSSRRTCVSALPRRARFVASLSQPLAPDGCGSGIATASPST